MPLRTEIDDLVLGEIDDDEGHCMFLLDPATHEFVAGARYTVTDGYMECINLVSEGFGPTMFLLLMQKARRDGLKGVAPDLEKNSDEAKRMDARFYDSSLPGVGRRPNPAANHPEVYLNQIYFLTQDLIAESRARRNAELFHAAGRRDESAGQRQAASQAVTEEPYRTESGLRKRLGEYLFTSELVHKERRSRQ